MSRRNESHLEFPDARDIRYYILGYCYTTISEHIHLAVSIILRDGSRVFMTSSGLIIGKEKFAFTPASPLTENEFFKLFGELRLFPKYMREMPMEMKAIVLKYTTKAYEENKKYLEKEWKEDVESYDRADSSSSPFSSPEKKKAKFATPSPKNSPEPIVLSPQLQTNTRPIQRELRFSVDDENVPNNKIQKSPSVMYGVKNRKVKRKQVKFYVPVVPHTSSSSSSSSDGENEMIPPINMYRRLGDEQGEGSSRNNQSAQQGGDRAESSSRISQGARESLNWEFKLIGDIMAQHHQNENSKKLLQGAKEKENKKASEANLKDLRKRTRRFFQNEKELKNLLKEAKSFLDSELYSTKAGTRAGTSDSKRTAGHMRLRNLDHHAPLLETPSLVHDSTFDTTYEPPQTAGRSRYRTFHHCDKCSFSSDSKFVLAQHKLEKHKIGKAAVCSCGFFCGSVRYLVRHLQFVRSEAMKNFPEVVGQLKAQQKLSANYHFDHATFLFIEVKGLSQFGNYVERRYANYRDYMIQNHMLVQQTSDFVRNSPHQLNTDEFMDE